MASRKMLQTDLETSKNEVAVVQNELQKLQSDHFQLSETLNDVQLMIDSRGWSPLFEHTEWGMGFEQVKLASRQLRELVVGNPLIKKGSQLRNAYIWGKGIEVDFGNAKPLQEKKLRALMATANNQRCLFSPDAQEEMERAAYTDGNVFVLGDDKTKKLQRVPLHEITGAYADPDDHEDIIALRRSWTRLTGSISENIVEWYYVDGYDGVRAPIIPALSAIETVNRSKTMFWQGYNKQIGWTWGVADALPVIAWSKLYKEFLINGSVMSKALAQIAYKLTAKTADGVAKSTAAIRDSKTAGQTVGLQSTMDLAPLSSAGKGYDFESGESLAAMVAIGIGLTAEDLLAKPDTDKADGIPGATKRDMRTRQRTQGRLIKRVLLWMGAADETVVSFPEIDDIDAFRFATALIAASGSGQFAGDETRPVIAQALGIPLLHATVPTGYLTPNNAATVKVNQPPAPVIAPAAPAGGSDVKPDGSTSQSNGQGRDNTQTGKTSAGDNTLRDGVNKK